MLSNTLKEKNGELKKAKGEAHMPGGKFIALPGIIPAAVVRGA